MKVIHLFKYIWTYHHTQNKTFFRDCRVGFKAISVSIIWFGRSSRSKRWFILHAQVPQQVILCRLFLCLGPSTLFSFRSFVFVSRPSAYSVSYQLTCVCVQVKMLLFVHHRLVRPVVQSRGGQTKGSLF